MCPRLSCSRLSLLRCGGGPRGQPFGRLLVIPMRGDRRLLQVPFSFVPRGAEGMAEVWSAVREPSASEPGQLAQGLAAPSTLLHPALFSSPPQRHVTPACGVSFLAPDIPDFHPDKRPLGTSPHVCGPLFLHQRPRHCDDRNHPLRLHQPWRQCGDSCPQGQSYLVLPFCLSL